MGGETRTSRLERRRNRSHRKANRGRGDGGVDLGPTRQRLGGGGAVGGRPRRNRHQLGPIPAHHVGRDQQVGGWTGEWEIRWA